MTNEEREKQIRIANMLIGTINDLKTPMLMYQVEKDVAQEALENYIKMLVEQQPTLDTRQRERQLEMEYQQGYDKGWEEGRKALEQQPCDDCISREAAIKKLKALSWTNYDLDDAAEVLKILPSVQPQRHKGMWKEFDTTFGRNIYYCTACGRSIEILYEYDFCPLCGADMRKREG